MTNQTIDGVPRELLESFAAYVADSPNAVMRSRAAQLRALLDAPAAEAQGDPVVLLELVGSKVYGGMHIAKWDNLGGLKEGSHRLYAEQPAPVAVVLPERSPKDYAIEHAEYMAKSADVVLAKFQAYGLALLAVDEGGDDGEGELLEAIDSTRQDLQESLVDLRGMVYEFRKRSNRCTPL